MAYNTGKQYPTLFRIGLALVLALLLGQSMSAPSTSQEPQVTVPDSVEIAADEKSDGRVITLKERQTLTLSLEANPSTGFMWKIVSMDDKIMRQVGRVQFQPYSDRVGAPGRLIRRFEAIGEGQTHLALSYQRPWESVPAAKTFSLQVVGVGPFASAGRSEEPAWLPESPTQETSLQEAGLAPGLPTSFNWCERGGCTPVKNQGSCGSCWAFATTAVLEAHIRIQQGEEKDLSEQYLVSCNTEGWGCNGGWQAHDYYWWKTPPGEPTAGAVYEGDFPYEVADVPCAPPNPHHERITSWAYVDRAFATPSVATIKQAIQEHGPVWTTVCSGPAFQNYTGGVFEADESWFCPSGFNHAVVLAGWDDTQGSEGAWLLKNSWGSQWGESGYMRIGYGVSNVGYHANYIVDGGTSGDAYEPDDNWEYARPVSHGKPQTHSIAPAGDADWVSFSLEAMSGVVLETSGRSGDTRMWLYDSDLSELDYDDDDGRGHFSRIDRSCTVDPLPAGTYFVMIAEYGGDDQIASYDFMFNALEACASVSAGPLVYNGHVIDDSSAGQGAGTEDGLVNCGELVGVYVELLNVGTAMAGEVSVTIQTDDPYLHWTGNMTSSYPDVPSQTVATNNEPFEFEMDSATPDGHAIALDLQIRAAGGASWSDAVSIPVTCQPTDPYEPDNSWTQAHHIDAGIGQQHSISPAGDVDWLRLTLHAESEVVLGTSGPSGDTRIWLYDGNLNQIDHDDDGGSNYFSRIDRACGVDPLAAGTYYVRIAGFGEDDEIPNYTFSVDASQPCMAGPAYRRYLPAAWRSPR